MEQLVEKRSYKCLMTCGRNDHYNPYLAVSCIYLSMVLIVPLSSVFIGYFVGGKLYNLAHRLQNCMMGL